MAPIFNYGKISAPQRRMLLENTLVLHGNDAVVTSAISFPGNYETVLPSGDGEFVYPNEVDYQQLNPPPAISRKSIKVFLGKAFKGLLVQGRPHLSLSDKVEDQIPIFTLDPLAMEDHVEVTMPDRKTINLRVIELKVQNPGTQMWSQAICQVL